MSKYTIKVIPEKECNPDFYPEEELQAGVDADEYVIIGFKNRKPVFEVIAGLTVRNLADWIRRKEKGSQIIRQACAIAEGEIRAMEIYEEEERKGTTILSGKMPELTDDMIRKIFGRDK